MARPFEEQPITQSGRPIARSCALLVAIGLSPLVLGGAPILLFWKLSMWSALLWLGMGVLAFGLFMFAFARRSANAALIVGAILIGAPNFAPAVLVGDSDGMRLTTLPGDAGTRIVNTLVPERDGCLFAAG